MAKGVENHESPSQKTTGVEVNAFLLRAKAR